MDQPNQTPNAQGQNQGNNGDDLKSYTVRGAVRNLKTYTARSGNEYGTFVMHRERDGKTVCTPCLLMGKPYQRFVEQGYTEGSEIAVLGVYDDGEVTLDTTEYGEIKAKAMTLRWTGPKEKPEGAGNNQQANNQAGQEANAGASAEEAAGAIF